MHKQFIFVTLSTLLIGFASGVYLYFLSRTPEEPEVITEDTSTEDRFEVIGNRYGGCERIGCTLYRIREDGGYTFIKYATEGTEERFEDTLTKSQQTNIISLLEDTDLARVEDSRSTGMCPVTYDGVAFKYEIRFEGNNFSFDSCEQDLENVPLFKELQNYFDIFRLIHGV